jgi:hypothetical protein
MRGIWLDQCRRRHTQDIHQRLNLHATVPLQKGWMESVGAKPVIDGRFIVGVGEHPGFVFAIDGSNDSGFEIREFAVINGKLGKVAVTR